MLTESKSTATPIASTKRRRKPSADVPTSSCTKNPRFEADSKKSRFLAMLQRSEGATFSELMTATGWQAHSVRGFISGVLRKKLGIDVALTDSPSGDRVYRVDV